jgi:hypothetical protein
VPPKEQPLARRVLTDPAFHDIIKLVGYQGVKMPIGETDYKRLVETYGRERISKASEDLVDIDAEKKIATLKVDVRKYCTAILGPAPEDWDRFYEGVINPPPNPYATEAKPKQTKSAKPEIDLVAEMGMTVEVTTPDPRSSEEMIRRLDDAALAELLAESKQGVNHHGPQSRQGRLLRQSVEMAEAEIARRARKAGQLPSEVETIRTTHGRRLRELLKGEHDRFQRHRPSEPGHQEAVWRMDLLESEMRRRGNKVPKRPIYREPYAPPADAPIAFNPRATVVAPVGLADVSKLSDMRLRELLDMNLRELETNDLDAIMYQEALRDIKLIEAERRRRDLPPDDSDEVA